MSVFIADQPQFHCAPPPEIQGLNCSQEDILKYSVPLIQNNGASKYSECQMYARKYSSANESDVCPASWSHDTINSQPEMTMNMTSSQEVTSCKRWSYHNEHYGSTLVTEWNLVCDRTVLAKNAAGIYLAARVIGTPLLGWLIDRSVKVQVLLLPFLLLPPPPSPRHPPPPPIPQKCFQSIKAINRLEIPF